MIFVVVGAVTAVGRSNPAPQLGLAAVFLVLAAAAVWWSRSCLVFAFADGVLIVRNPLRTHELAWQDISGFEVRDSRWASPNGRRRRLVTLRRVDGSHITCIGACAMGSTAAANMKGQLDDALAHRLWSRR